MEMAVLLVCLQMHRLCTHNMFLQYLPEWPSHKLRCNHKAELVDLLMHICDHLWEKGSLCGFGQMLDLHIILKRIPRGIQ